MLMDIGANRTLSNQNDDEKHHADTGMIRDDVGRAFERRDCQDEQRRKRADYHRNDTLG
jgi:hypothetical protein